MREQEIITAKYRMTFLNSDIGQEVLSDILTICHFGETITPALMDEYNVGVAILARLGIFGPGTRRDVVRALSSVIPNQGEEKKNEEEKRVFTDDDAGRPVLLSGLDG